MIVPFMLLRRSFTTTITCFRAEAVSKNARIPGYGNRSGFAVYISENIAKIEGSSTSKIKELSEKWKKESETVKEMFSKKASLLNEENKEKFESLSQVEKDKLIQEAHQKREKRKHRKLKAIKKEKRVEIVNAIGMDKPVNAFIQFVKEYYKNNPNEKVSPENTEKISLMWKNLPENERQERERQSKEAFDLWNKKKDEYLKKIDNNEI
ncbi:High mobility group box domain-containing protein [Strongyloides ratti]|uniref:High mobility group box domain-containing protein n=1 Tax=Strongyloides ratti TaxID=34506 RepID=A0A090L1N2_STRRB|nr:High mobility group box domain-containing protein [Strongyloides ratti]CEF63607.1 High mobility group box domain-containing protein [Strongyloides ratti]